MTTQSVPACEAEEDESAYTQEMERAAEQALSGLDCSYETFKARAELTNAFYARVASVGPERAAQ